MASCLQIFSPEASGAENILRLRGLITAGQKDDDRVAVFAEIDSIPAAEHQTRFPHSAAAALVVAKIARLKPQHTGLNPGSHGNIDCAEPLAKWASPVPGKKFSDRERHQPLAYHM